MKPSKQLETLDQFHQRSTSSFYASRSQKCKKDNQVFSLFVLLESERAKAASKMLMKLTPCPLNAKRNGLVNFNFNSLKNVKKY
jgi:hypothetical protein